PCSYCSRSAIHQDLHSFPTRRSSDLGLTAVRTQIVLASRFAGLPAPIDGVSLEFHDEAVLRQAAADSRALGFGGKLCIHPRQVEDRKSTRLNSSHVKISYAVFCLKKK